MFCYSVSRSARCCDQVLSIFRYQLCWNRLLGTDSAYTRRKLMHCMALMECTVKEIIPTVFSSGWLSIQSVIICFVLLFCGKECNLPGHDFVCSGTQLLTLLERLVIKSGSTEKLLILIRFD